MKPGEARFFLLQFHFHCWFPVIVNIVDPIVSNIVCILIGNIVGEVLMMLLELIFTKWQSCSQASTDI